MDHPVHNHIIIILRRSIPCNDQSIYFIIINAPVDRYCAHSYRFVHVITMDDEVTSIS